MSGFGGKADLRPRRSEFAVLLGDGAVGLLGVGLDCCLRRPRQVRPGGGQGSAHGVETHGRGRDLGGNRVRGCCPRISAKLLKPTPDLPRAVRPQRQISRNAIFKGVSCVFLGRDVLSLWEKVARIDRCEPDEGSASAERIPHPSAMRRIASTLSHKGRGEEVRGYPHEILLLLAIAGELSGAHRAQSQKPAGRGRVR